MINSEDKGRKKLKIDLSELVFEMEMGDNMERSGYLDTETGEIIDMPDDVMRAMDDGKTGEDLAEVAGKILGDETNRFLLIPKRESGEGYEVMVSFAGSVEDRNLQEKLEIALDGKGAFRRFRNVLNQHPDELERWYKFKDDWMLRSSGFLRTASSRCRLFPAISMTTGQSSIPILFQSRDCV